MDYGTDQIKNWKDPEGARGESGADHPAGKLGPILGSRVAMRAGALAGLTMATMGLLDESRAGGGGWTPLMTATGTGQEHTG